MKKIVIPAFIILFFVQCAGPEKKETVMNTGISETTITATVDSIVKKYGEPSRALAL